MSTLNEWAMNLKKSVEQSPPAFRSQVERTPKKNLSDEDAVLIPPQTPIRWIENRPWSLWKKIKRVMGVNNILVCKIFKNKNKIYKYIKIFKSQSFDTALRFLVLYADSWGDVIVYILWVLSSALSDCCVVSSELQWPPFSSWGVISPLVGTSRQLTWLRISK